VVCKTIGCSIQGEKEIEWLNKSSGVELSPGPEGSATRRFSISESPLDDSLVERIRPILMLPAEIVEEEEVDAPIVSEVCATENDSGDGIQEVSPEFHSRVELCARNLREYRGHIQEPKRLCGPSSFRANRLSKASIPRPIDLGLWKSLAFFAMLRKMVYCTPSSGI